MLHHIFKLNARILNRAAPAAAGQYHTAFGVCVLYAWFCVPMPSSDPALCVSECSMHPLILCAYALFISCTLCVCVLNASLRSVCPCPFQILRSVCLCSLCIPWFCVPMPSTNTLCVSCVTLRLYVLCECICCM